MRSRVISALGTRERLIGRRSLRSPRARPRRSGGRLLYLLRRQAALHAPEEARGRNATLDRTAVAASPLRSPARHRRSAMAKCRVLVACSRARTMCVADGRRAERSTPSHAARSGGGFPPRSTAKAPALDVRPEREHERGSTRAAWQLLRAAPRRCSMVFARVAPPRRELGIAFQRHQRPSEPERGRRGARAEHPPPPSLPTPTSAVADGRAALAIVCERDVGRHVNASVVLAALDTHARSGGLSAGGKTSRLAGGRAAGGASALGRCHVLMPRPSRHGRRGHVGLPSPPGGGVAAA